MGNAHGAVMPLEVHVRLDIAEDGKDREAGPVECQAVVGSLMYIAPATRPDISCAVSILGWYTSRPHSSHQRAAKWVQRFLKSTFYHRHYFGSEGNRVIAGRLISLITGYADTDWANDSVDRRSERDHVNNLNSGAISWKSWKHDSVATWTTEVAYIAYLNTWREAWRLRCLRRDVDRIPATDDPDDTEAKPAGQLLPPPTHV